MRDIVLWLLFVFVGAVVLDATKDVGTSPSSPDENGVVTSERHG